MEFEFVNLRIFVINIFLILLKVTTLNPYKLKRELNEIEFIVKSQCDLCNHFLIIFISMYLEAKFVMGYITLASNIIALFPILTDDLPHLLLPALFAQSIDHIAFNIFEIIVGCTAIKLMGADMMNVVFVFLPSKVMNIMLAIMALNVYSNYYKHLKFAPLHFLAPSVLSQVQFMKSK